MSSLDLTEMGLKLKRFQGAQHQDKEPRTLNIDSYGWVESVFHSIPPTTHPIPTPNQNPASLCHSEHPSKEQDLISA